MGKGGGGRASISRGAARLCGKGGGESGLSRGFSFFPSFFLFFLSVLESYASFPLIFFPFLHHQEFDSFFYPHDIPPPPPSLLSFFSPSYHFKGEGENRGGWRRRIEMEEEKEREEWEGGVVVGLLVVVTGVVGWGWRMGWGWRKG